MTQKKKSSINTSSERSIKFSENFLKTILIIVFVIAILSVLNVLSNIYDEELKGDAIITYEYVNYRSSPKGEVKGQFFRGQRVKLTGKNHEFLGGDDQLGTDNWVEVQMEDGSKVWIVRSSVNPNIRP